MKIAEQRENKYIYVIYLTARDVKKKVKYAVIPLEETWRISIINNIRSMLNMETDNMTGISQDEMTEVLEHSCYSLTF